MTDQTPSTEDVRVLAALNAYYNVRHYGDTRAIAALDDYHPNNVEAMRAAVRAARNPAHDREVAAQALYDARDDWRKGGWAGTPHHHDRGRDRIAAAQYVGDWLDTRADRIEAGE